MAQGNYKPFETPCVSTYVSLFYLCLWTFWHCFQLIFQSFQRRRTKITLKYKQVWKHPIENPILCKTWTWNTPSIQYKCSGKLKMYTIYCMQYAKWMYAFISIMATAVKDAEGKNYVTDSGQSNQLSRPYHAPITHIYQTHKTVRIYYNTHNSKKTDRGTHVIQQARFV